MDVSEKLADLMNGVEEAIEDHAGGDREDLAYNAIQGLCVILELFDINVDIESEVQENHESEDYDRTFIKAVNADYAEVKKQFEVAVREFYDTHDFLKFKSSLKSIRFF